jgi:hypothetical protein
MATVSGFYAIKDEMTATFYVTTTLPPELKTGAQLLNLPGIIGNALVTTVLPFRGSHQTYGAYNGSFDFQADKAQTIQGIVPVSTVTLSSAPFSNAPPVYSMDGTYFVSNYKVYFYATTPFPPGLKKGWLLTNLPGVAPVLQVRAFQSVPGIWPRPKYPGDPTPVTKYMGTIITSPVPPLAPLPTNSPPGGTRVQNQAILAAPVTTVGFIPQPLNLAPPQILTLPPLDDDNFPRFPVDLRDLDAEPPGHVMLNDNNLTEKSRLGFSAGGVLALDAIGPQEKLIADTTDFTQGAWTPSYKQYSLSVVYQQRVPVPGTTFIRRTEPGVAVVELRPTELGDLFSNMHLQVTLPALSAGSAYTNQIGRALIEKVEFIVNETVIETIYDDWLVIRDQTFLDYDEQVGMLNLVNGGQANQNLTPSTPLNLLIPLEFFFCRRHSHENKARERLRRPYFPVCAMWAQKIYIRFTFRPQTWFTNAPGTIDLINPYIVLESVRLTDAERLYYRNQPLRYIVPTIKKESTAEYNQGAVTATLTANFPVQLLAWFIRNKNYEGTQNSNFYDVRYLYGYASQYITAAVPLSFPTGQAQYIDSIETVKITMNNVDILDTFANGTYCSFIQPMEHGLSVPQKNIYLYSFGLNVTEYNQGGYIDFSKLNSQTSNLTLKFLPELAATITQYALYLFYYGYSVLEFQGGFARMAYL